ncbi:hypothetical protein GJ26_02505 [Vibrio cholerae]|nr:hypothetical protein GJ26_02505 [Vibrio cholerae]
MGHRCPIFDFCSSAPLPRYPLFFLSYAQMTKIAFQHFILQIFAKHCTLNCKTQIYSLKKL